MVHKTNNTRKGSASSGTFTRLGRYSAEAASWTLGLFYWLLQQTRNDCHNLQLTQSITRGFALSPRVVSFLQPLDLAGDDSATPSTGKCSVHTGLRKRQFEAGRCCAASLLESLGSGDTLVSVHEDLSPMWPVGYVGSISHTDTLLGVAVARSSDLRAIGIDIEGIVSLQIAREIEQMCLNQSELLRRVWLGFDRRIYAALCFSAKEALFKCLYPLVQRYFDFHDAEIIDICHRMGTVRLRLTQDLSDEFKTGNILVGRYRWDGVHVFTSFELPRQEVAKDYLYHSL